MIASTADAAVVRKRARPANARYLVLERRDIREAVRITFWLVTGVLLIDGAVMASQSPAFAAASFGAAAALLLLQVAWRRGRERRPHEVAFAIGAVMMTMGIPASAMTPAIASAIVGEFAVAVVGCSVFIPWGLRWHIGYLAMSACGLAVGLALLRADDSQRLAILMVGTLAIGTSVVGNMFTRQRRERAWAQEFRLRQQRAELRRTVARLDTANSTIQRLEGILPICAGCKRIRDGADWRQIESYISAHSAAQFSHGICPDCERRLYGQVSEGEI